MDSSSRIAALRLTLLLLGLTLASGMETVRANNLVPNPGFQTGPQNPVAGCFVDCPITENFDDRIDNWKAALRNPNCVPCALCPAASLASPDWIDLNDNTDQCASTQNNLPGNTNTSTRFVRLGSRDHDDYAEGVRVGLNSRLRSGTTYILTLRACLLESFVDDGGRLRVHFTEWGEHWASDDQDNTRMTDITNFVIPPNSPHQWYTFQHVFTVPEDKDDQLTTLVLLAHYDENVGWCVDDVDLRVCTAAVSPQPASVDVFGGETIVLSAGYSGPPTPSFQWRKRTGAAVDFNDGRHSGVNTSTMTITDATEDDEGEYDLVIDGPCGQIVSNTAFVTVCAGHVAITQQPPALINVNAGADLDIDVGVSGPSPMYLHWYKGQLGLVDGPRITGTSTSTLHIASVQSTDSGVYFLEVGSDCESIRTINVQLVVIGGVVLPAARWLDLLVLALGFAVLGSAFLGRISSRDAT